MCLHKKPAKTPAGIASGAKNRYDDFVVTHILQSYEVHGTVCAVKDYIPKIDIDRAFVGQLPRMAPLLHMGL